MNRARVPSVVLAFSLTLFASALAAEEPTLSIRVLPEAPLLVATRDGQSVHCDFVVKNATQETVTLDSIEVAVYDKDGGLAQRRFAGSNGMPGAIATVPVREIAPGGELLVFNPLHTFDAALPIARLHFTFRFDAGEDWRKYVVETNVTPSRRATKAKLALPLRGRVFVHDGHDFYSHHRRLDLTHPFVKAVGATGVSGRYASDFVVVDEKGSMFRGNGAKLDDWLGWGAPVYAPGAGVVVYAENTIPDNSYAEGDPGNAGPEALGQRDAAVRLDKPVTIAGNAVVLDHGNGEYSMIAHMKKGSVAVKAGDVVKTGQQLGELGMSGDSMLPHVHYQLQNGPDLFKSEGLPSIFTGLRRVIGAQAIPWPSGIIDSGDIVIAK